MVDIAMVLAFQDVQCQCWLETSTLPLTVVSTGLLFTVKDSAINYRSEERSGLSVSVYKLHGIGQAFKNLRLMKKNKK